jgi:hypothetical protein
MIYLFCPPLITHSQDLFKTQKCGFVALFIWHCLWLLVGIAWLGVVDDSDGRMPEIDCING